MSDLPYELKTIPGYRARAGGPQIGQYIGAMYWGPPPHPTPRAPRRTDNADRAQMRTARTTTCG